MLTRYNPDSPFRQIQRLMDRMWDSMGRDLPALDHDWMQPGDANLLDVDMTSDEKSVIVRTAIPGVKEDEINVDVNGNVLTISAETQSEREDGDENWHMREMRYGKFSRSVRLPEEVAVGKAEASLENGILTVTLPKEKPNPAQKIAVKAKKMLKS